MAHAASLPIPAGQTEAVRHLLSESLGPRRAEYEDLQRRSGITEETYWLQSSPEGDVLIVVSNRDQSAFMEIMANPQTPFDHWFRDQMEEIWGAGQNAQPAPPNELIGSWP